MIALIRGLIADWQAARAERERQRWWAEQDRIEEARQDEQGRHLRLVTVEEVPPDIQRKYRRTSPMAWACRKCGTEVKSIKFTPSGDTPPRDYYGRFIDVEVIPYCPVCEPVPSVPWPALPNEERFCDVCGKKTLFTVHPGKKECHVCESPSWDP